MNYKHLLASLLCGLCAVTAQAVDLYLSDNVVNVSPGLSTTNNGTGWKFTYDAVREVYYLTVPGGTVTNSNYRSGDFQISTKTGSYANWQTGLIWAPSANNSNGNKIYPGTVYSLTDVVREGESTHSAWMTLSPYDYSVDYTFFISKDVDKLWVVPSAYMSDNVTRTNASSSSANGVGWQFFFDPDEQYYFLRVPAATSVATSDPGDFQVSRHTGSYAKWKTGLVYLTDYNNTTSVAVPADGIARACTKVGSSNATSYWMTVADFDKTRDYTFYMNSDMTQMWVIESRTELYLSDNVVNLSPANTTYNGEDWKFSYSAYGDYYYLRVPGYTATNTSFRTGDFQISNMPGTPDLWRRGTFYMTDFNNSNSVSVWANGVKRNVTAASSAPDNTTYHWMTIANYDYTEPYTFYVSGDLTQMWVEKDVIDLYLGDHLCGNSGNYTESNVKKFTYDSTNEMYIVTVPAGSVSAALGDLQLSVQPGTNDEWREGLLYVPGKDITSESNRTESKYLEANTSYPLQLSTDGGYHWMSVKNFSTAKEYTIGVTKDFSEIAFVETRPSLYLSDNVVGVSPMNSFTNGEGWQFNYDSNNDYYWITVPGGTTTMTTGDFQVSRSPGNYDTWVKGLLFMNDSYNTSGTTTNRIPANGVHHPVSAVSSSNTGSRWMSIKNYENTKDYTFYVSGDLTEMWVTTNRPDIYLGDEVTGHNCTSSSAPTEANVLRFTYDNVTDTYTLTLPANTGLSGAGVYGDFQISTIPGSYDEWRTGLFYVHGGDQSTGRSSDKNVNPNGTWHNLASSSDGTSHWSTIGNYDSANAYTITIKGNLSQIKISRERPQKLYIIGHLTHDLRASYNYYEGGSIREFEYDPEEDVYCFTMAGARWSVFEISTTPPAPLSNNYAYRDWVNGMVAFMPTYSEDTDDFFGSHRAGEPVIQPVLQTNPFNGDPDIFIKYPASRGDADAGQAGKRDMSIEGYNPDWLYRVYCSGDLSKIWITEQPINMPLKAAEFYDDTDLSNVKAVPHYFVTGTRTADWRLLPEWELKGTGNTRSLSGRFMYDGYFGIAKTDTYLDYIQHKYSIFANRNAADQDYKIYDSNRQIIESTYQEDVTLHSVALKNCGAARALLYREDDTVFSTANAITWDIGVGGFASAGGVPTADMMRKALPFRFSSLSIDLDANGNPTQLNPKGSYNRHVLHMHRTFNLVGSDINYETPYDFANALGIRDLREMTSAYADANTTEKNWYNTWISYDDNSVPYYDAYENTLFVTAFDREWQTNHSTIFDIDLGEGENELFNRQMFEYSSDHLIFNVADPNDMEDEYSWIYGMHPNIANGDRTVGSDYIGWDSAKNAYVVIDDQHNPETNYRYQERLADYDVSWKAAVTDHGNQIGDNGAPEPATAEKSKTDGWICYVLKDVYLRGDFIVGSGWGGNVVTSEGYTITEADRTAGNIPRNNLRLYFGNFSPRRGNGGVTSGDTWAYPVKGYDYKTTFDLENGSPNDNAKVLYRTYRDIDETNFRTEGASSSADSYAETGQLQFYNRIILWYNTNTDRTVYGLDAPNGVIQFIQEELAPNAKAYRQTGYNNKLYVRWNLVKHSDDTAMDNWPVISYQVQRYHYVPVVVNGETTMQPQLYREFDPIEVTDNTVADLLTESIRFDDPYALPPGDYFYRVTVTIQNPNDGGDIRSKTATTNTLSVADSEKPLLITAEQPTELVDGKVHYSFNVKLSSRLTTNSAILNTESSHETAVWKDIDRIEIIVNDATRAMLETCTWAEFANVNRAQVINADIDEHASRPGNSSHFSDFNVSETRITYGYVGWGLDSEYADADGNPKFVHVDNDVNKIVFKLQPFYKTSSAAADWWRYANSMSNLVSCFELPQIIWHNVQPTSNISGGDLSAYSFEAELKPVEGYRRIYIDENTLVIKSIEDYWSENLGFIPDDAETDVYAPGVKIDITPRLQKSDAQANYAGIDYTNTSHIANMPMGSHSYSNFEEGTKPQATAPVHYNALNEIVADIHTLLPVTDEVLANVAIGYSDLSVGGRYGTPIETSVDAAVRYDDSNNPTADIAALLRHLPYYNYENTPAMRFDAVPAVGSKEGVYEHSKLPEASVSYAATARAVYSRTAWGDNTFTARTNTPAVKALDVSRLAAPTFSIADDPIFVAYYGPGCTEYEFNDIWGRAVFAIKLDGWDPSADDALYAYFGYNTTPTVEGNDFGQKSQGGCPVYSTGNDDSDFNVWGPVANPTNANVNAGYVAWSTGDEYSESNNWSYLAANSNYLSICVDPILKVDRRNNTWENFPWPEINVTGYVTYPLVPSEFAVLELGSHTASPSPAPAKAPAVTPVPFNKIAVLTGEAPQLTIRPETSQLTGVEDIAASEADAVYYNLQGMRVSSPQPGQVYIVRRGPSITKVLYK